MQEKGIISVTVAGKPRTFKYGMKSTLRFQSAFNNVGDLSRNEFLVGVLWVGLICGDKDGSNDLPEGFSDKSKGMDMTADWIDTMSLEDCAQIYNVAEASLGFTMEVMEKAKQNQESQPLP